MKFKLRILIALFALFAILTALPLSVGAAQAESGVEYRISDDRTYVTVTGITEEFPRVKIEAEIEGLPVKEIAPSAFQNNYSLYSIEIPDSVTVIGEAAFRNCQSLVSVRLPSGLTELPTDAFRDCYVLNSVTLPDTLTSIGDFCFQGCKKLGRLTVPASVDNIGHDAFMECESITLDVKSNGYAAEYAKLNSVNTDFKGTGAYFLLVVLLGTAALLSAVLLISRLVKGYLKKQRNK